MQTSLAIPYHLCPKCLRFQRGTRCRSCNFGLFLADEWDKRGTAIDGRLLVGTCFGIASRVTALPKTVRDRFEREAVDLALPWLAEKVGRLL